MKRKFKRTAEKCAVCFFLAGKTHVAIQETSDKEFNNSLISNIYLTPKSYGKQKK